MSTRNTAVITVKAGADMACQIVWSDDNGNPMPADVPARAEVRGDGNTLLVAFDDGADPATEAAISCSPSDGIIQLTAPKAVTSGWTPGVYNVDVFTTVEAAPPFDVSGQYRPAFTGQFIVSQAYTTGAP